LKPYYEASGITIYHGDCREILPQLPKDCADLLVADPPYGVEYQSSYRTLRFAPIVGDHSSELALEGTAAALKCLRVERHVYLFGRYDLSGLPLTPAVELIWDKQTLSMGDLEIPWGSQHEAIMFAILKAKAHRENGKGGLAARLRRGSVLSYPRPQAERHPTEKPVDLIRELIESSSRIGETVLDYFCGIGSTLVAAQQEGRRAIGIEIEEKYAEIAAKRLSQEVFQF
jgi:DNA modification methylase